VLRNLGVALGHTLIAWTALGRGLTKIEADRERMSADLDASWEVLGEAVQSVLRAAGVPGGYERLKEFTRGRAIDAATLAAFIDSLPLKAADKSRLRALTPQGYTGLAALLARQV
jgi:adenylosuccinate lyase